ncbi:MAG: hypothetical protein LBM13_04410 [Candidatus Ancillula sp.]|jgi:hypothetical protein|nr:hypothetical protein [Candidatus Ancillula sp.]
MTEQDRKSILESAFHSSEMEGLRVTDELRKESDDYIAGKVTSTELIAKAKARYGIA